MATDAITPAAEFLTSTMAAPALADLAAVDVSEERTLAVLAGLRSRYTPEEAGALLALARLRKRATEKFTAAAQMFFTSEALEQATNEVIAAHHAASLEALAGPGPLLDLGCGIGGDTLALAARRPVIAYELDPARLRFAQANAAALGLADRVAFRRADWVAELAAGRLPAAGGAFVDPARRRAGKRVFSLHDMTPPLAAITALAERYPAVAAKVMPGVADEELPAECGVEFIGHAGQCKEGLLWFGLATRGRRWATVHTGSEWVQIAASGRTPPLGPLAAGDFLHEPHAAVIRAGALAEMCATLVAHLVDPHIAYLAASVLVRHPLAQSFAVWDVQPFSLKRLNGWLTAYELGQVELKKRGFPVEPESLRPRLHLAPGGRPGVVFFTRRGDERLMVLGERLA